VLQLADVLVLYRLYALIRYIRTPNDLVWYTSVAVR
jgi:hypothetical protein